MTDVDTAVGPTVVQRWRSARWVALALVVIVGVAALSTYLTAPRPGGRMDPASTSPEGARALVTLLRDHGVDVIAADDIESVWQQILAFDSSNAPLDHVAGDNVYRLGAL